jgi:hypothetical protein
MRRCESSISRSSVVPDRPQPPRTIGANGEGAAAENESAA